MTNVNPNPHQRTYAMNHPALDPLASGKDDYPAAAAIHAGEVIQDEHLVAASVQHKTFGVVPLPVGQDLLTQALMNRVEDLTQTVVRMEGTMIQMSIQIAKNTNRTLEPSETIVPVPNLCGEFSPENIFPRTQGYFFSKIQAHDVEELLRFYGVDIPQEMNRYEKISVLCSHLGLMTLAQLFHRDEDAAMES
jgi:hypothetical protein